MARNTNIENFNQNAMAQEIFSCKSCSLSSDEVQGGCSMKQWAIDLKHFNYKKISNAIEKRHGILINRRQHLCDKILNMEKTMPLVMAYNICMSDGNDRNIIINKVQDMIKELSCTSSLNSDEKIIEETKNRILTLNTEITKLHEKIIEADVKLEESQMQLDSLQVVNNELNEKLSTIEGQSTNVMGSCDFQLLDQDDLNCLSTLRQLIQQEIRMKSYISALEDRENCIRIQLNGILLMNEQKNQSMLTTPGNDKISNEHEYCECCKCDEPIADSN